MRTFEFLVYEYLLTVNNSNPGIILITHYQRLLDYIKPNYVHIMMNGKIIKSGDFSLVHEIEKSGYEKIFEEISSNEIKD